MVGKALAFLRLCSSAVLQDRVCEVSDWRNLGQAASTADSQLQCVASKRPTPPSSAFRDFLDQFSVLSMASWHKQDCTTPDIAVDESTGLPSCMSCKSAPDLDEIIRQQSQKSSFPAPPPDEPPGQLNLWWPRSVPYFNQASTHPKSQLDFSPSTAPTPRPPFEPSRTYPTQLKPNEIRLACFHTAGAPPSPDAPVHITLETYSLSNCPPYETVSYCWSGERTGMMPAPGPSISSPTGMLCYTPRIAGACCSL
jgi:hypothetical protein